MQPPAQSSPVMRGGPRLGSVMIVDDEAAIRALWTSWLHSAGYAVQTATSAEDALGQMARQPAAVALCDVGLPGHDGLWLADRIRRGYPETAVIMATGSQDVEPAVASLRHGVVDYLLKPFARERLQEAVGRGLDWHASARHARERRARIDREATVRQSRLAEAMAALGIDSDSKLDALLAVVTIDDRESYEHLRRVGALAGRTARALWLDGAELAAIQHGALLHDIGTLVIPQHVLLKPATLTADEQRLMRRHPAIGCALLERVPYLSAAAVIVRDAHERVDGLGFPAGSRGADVGIGARIVAVSDAFDTMTRPRGGREPLSVAEAMAEIAGGANTQFDSQVVAAFPAPLAS